MMPGATAVAPAIGRKPMIPSDPWTNRAGGHGGFAVGTLGSAGRAVLLTAFLTGETVSHFGILFAYVRTIQPLFLNGYRVPSVKPFSEFGSIGEANTYGTASSKRRRSH